MTQLVRMPAALAGVEEAAIQSWLVAPGQAVAAGEPLAEIETEKAVVDYLAESSGTVSRLLVEAGENVPVGTPIAVLLDAGETEEDPDAVASSSAPSGGGAASRATESASEAPAAPGAPRLFASPLVRRLAQERGLDLAGIVGTGPAGRIVRRDLERATAPATAPARALTATPDPEQAMAAGSGRDLPVTPMRRTIARRLVESVTTVPHFFLTADCKVDRLLALRADINAVAPRRVSLNDLVIAAVGQALRAVPEANAVWLGDSIRQFDTADVALAVALEGGLVTPVVRGVDRLGVVALSEVVEELATRARAGRLQQHELEGGAFTVSNLGMFGVTEFSAIINPPHSGILAVGAATPRPVVLDGVLSVATVMTVTLSADHRVLDGASAARWLGAFVERIENPVRLLLGAA
ncbi:MAG: dihydrolipoamide acetyltransferase family protein [Protaetiibacter sp.]